MNEPRPRTSAPWIVCGGCDTVWTAPGAAHCAASGCHRTFGGVSLFDAHRSTRGGDHGSCVDPEALTNTAGERIAFFRNGMWRSPEMTDEQKLARFGDRTGAA